MPKTYEGLFEFDQKIRQKGFLVFAGIDEAGRGPWAGPVVAAAVILPENKQIPGLNDSKKLNPSQREAVFSLVTESALGIGVGISTHFEIDETSILLATENAMKKAIEALGSCPGLFLIDGNRIIPGLKYRQEALVKGDSISASIAAASVIAKVTRDRIMLDLSKQYPEYGFEKHKGYGTKEHLNALMANGPCPVHRKSFAPVRKLLKE